MNLRLFTWVSEERWPSRSKKKSDSQAVSRSFRKMPVKKNVVQKTDSSRGLERIEVRSQGANL